MHCYFIARITIRDSEEYSKYLEGFDSVIAAYNAKVLAVDDRPTILEGHFTCSRVVLIRFGSEEEAKRWYDSVEYQKLAEHRWRASDADVVLANGRD
jgi:uncharacterized protein (DUF1330 family)